MQEDFDFITNTLIIGGGPAGSTLARKLAIKNVDTILIEKNFSFDKPCGGGVKSIIFEEFNIPQEYEYKKIKTFSLFSPENKVDIDLSKTPISIVLRKEFDEANRQLAKRDGAQVIEGRYKGIEYLDNFIIAKIKTKEKILKIKTKYLVGADGVTSSVKKDLFGSYPNSILTQYCNVLSNSIDRCEFHFGKEFAPKEYAWVFPHGNKLSVGTVLRKENRSNNLFKNFKDTIVKNDTTKTKGFYIPYWKKNTLLYKNNVFFVGDAAEQVLPFTYEGIYYAMKSAELLSEAIILDKPELYETNWNKKYKKRFKFFRITQTIFLSSDFMIEKMLKFFKNKKLQQSGLNYWEGTTAPMKLGQTVLKIIKHGIKN